MFMQQFRSNNYLQTNLRYTHVTINMSITIQKANVIRRATVVAVDVAVTSKGDSAVSGPTL